MLFSAFVTKQFGVAFLIHRNYWASTGERIVGFLLAFREKSWENIDLKNQVSAFLGIPRKCLAFFFNYTEKGLGHYLFLLECWQKIVKRTLTSLVLFRGMFKNQNTYKNQNILFNWKYLRNYNFLMWWYKCNI